MVLRRLVANVHPRWVSPDGLASVALLELHNVLRESACLVTEHKLYLAKLLDEVRIPAERVLHVLHEEHAHITVYEHPLQKFEHLNYHIETDRNQLRVGHPKSEELNEESICTLLFVQLKVKQPWTILMRPLKGKR